MSIGGGNGPVIAKLVRFTAKDLTDDEWWVFAKVMRQRHHRVGEAIGLYIRALVKEFGNANSDKGPGEGL